MAPVQSAQTRIVDLPLDRPVRSATHDIDRVTNVVVELHADGITGMGYAVALATAHARAIDELARDLASRVIGLEPSSVREWWQATWQELNFVGQAGPSVMALAAVDTALWDLHARQLGQPLHRLLGAGRPRLRAYATGGWLSSTLDELVEEAQSVRERGLGWFKLKVGMPDPDEDVARIAALREHFPDLGLMVDANQAWRPAEAINRGRRLQELGILWLEEPVDVADVAGSAQVAAALDVPVCAGETVFGAAAVLRLIRERAADVINPDLMRCGGITGLLDVTTAATALGVEVTPHTFLESSAQVLAVAGDGFVEYVPGWWDRLFAEPFAFADGCLVLPSEPGLGVTLSDQAREDHTVQRWRTDGEKTVDL